MNIYKSIADNWVQWLIFMSVNIIFILKYTARTAYSPIVFALVYFTLSLATIYVYTKIINKENKAKYATIILLFFAFLLIGILLHKIDPLSVNVDRWSATTYFLNGLKDNIYPYGIHTHVSETNFPSPFPFWHYINFPFWLLGDVGIGLFFFLLLLVTAIYLFTNSWIKTSGYLLLLVISPSYWWEVMVRSDGLSNAILVFSCILLMEKKRISFQNNWLLTSIICGFLASTRLSAIIPLAIYSVKPYFMISSQKKIWSLITIILIVFLFFSPYIFWDTEEWVFFSRNPFMSQSSTGNIWILVIMSMTALYLAFVYNNNFYRYMSSTSLFIFVFFLVSIMLNHYLNNSDISAFEDADFDISYLILSFPYCLYSIVNRNPK